MLLKEKMDDIVVYTIVLCMYHIPFNPNSCIKVKLNSVFDFTQSSLIFYTYNIQN